MLKKFLFGLLLAGFLSTGCASSFMEHDTMYKNNDHMMFSIVNSFGDQEVSAEDVQKSADQGWWGEAIGYQK